MPGTNSSIPSISIGMPVYNGERDIAAALDSILAQTFADFELVISDNASTDETALICQAYAGRDSRIRYFRQSTNIGGTPNFRFVLMESRADYFVWAAADDIKSIDFLAANLTFLRRHTDYIGSTSPVRFRGQAHDEIKMGDAALDDSDPYDRILRAFNGWHANGRFYSLFHRAALLNWRHLDDFAFLGSDWTLITHLARCGKLGRVDTGWVELGTNGMSNRPDIFARFRRRKIEWLLPFYTLMQDGMRQLQGARLDQKRSLLWKLLKLNYQAVRLQIKFWRQRVRTRRKKLESLVKQWFGVA
jgi:glycosyltransferase involved in cell wall biosynthesis